MWTRNVKEGRSVRGKEVREGKKRERSKRERSKRERSEMVSCDRRKTFLTKWRVLRLKIPKEGTTRERSLQDEKTMTMTREGKRGKIEGVACLTGRSSLSSHSFLSLSLFVTFVTFPLERL